MKTDPPADTHSDNEIVSRLVRIESKLTQLMQFMGMGSDGRNPIAPSKPRKLLTQREKSK